MNVVFKNVNYITLTKFHIKLNLKNVYCFEKNCKSLFLSIKT